MKKIVLFSFALTGLFASCKKSSPAAPTYSVTATIAGTATNFTAQPPVATTQTTGNTTVINIDGLANASTHESIVITIDNFNGGGPIVGGKYSDTSTVFDVNATYFVNQTTQYQAGTDVYSLASPAGVTITHHFLLTITAINANGITGTFSGDFFSNGDPTAAVKTVTNGSFNVKFQ